VVVRLSALDRAGQQRVSFHKMQDLVSPATGGAPTTTLEKGVAQTFEGYHQLPA
jgi:hypothetical protein